MLRAAWTLTVVTLVTGAFGIPAMVALAFGADADLAIRAGRGWSRTILRLLGIRIRYEGLERTTAHLPCLFVSNHQSNVDIWALFQVLPDSVRFVAKRELFGIPVVGQVLRQAGFVSVDRRNRQESIRSLERAAATVRAGRPLVLFPEGTRSPDERLLPFKKGPFHLALAARVPLVPVVIEGSGRLLPRGSAAASAGTVRVRFLPPVDPRPWLPGDHDGLRLAVQAAMARALGEEPTVSSDPAAHGPR